MKSKIHYTKPSITDLEVAYATDAAKNGWGEKCYEYIEKFETKFKAFTGAQYAIATSSCTGALHMGLAAIGVGLGDEVILADTNWIATAAPITYLGAKPIFVDILEDTWCIDPEKIEAAITPNTKAIIATHIYGNVCEMDKLMAIGQKHGIPIIEDAAEAIGSQWHGKHAGTIGQFGTFSFHGTKTLTTGEGGIFITNDAQLYEKVLTLSNHGRAKGQTKQFWPDEIGFKYKMSNIQAAIGFGQIERIEDLIRRKREVFQYYKTQLAAVTNIEMNPEKSNTINGYWMPTVVFDKSTGITREKLQAAFAEENIDARVFFYPLSSLDMFNNRLSNTIAWDIPNRAINLPSFVDITLEEQDQVVDVIKKFLQIG
ncbi:MAG: DegT/DnrJ/EryC1/StrS aminotransferase family protein [Methylophilaceae bacterium]|nr:MAG: DegT/DnrJ/EryC1/StrS aminotransferase family protein [Methylophilaceae bacterium]